MPTGETHRPSVEAFRAAVLSRSATERLAAHVEATHGVRATNVVRLDIGVFRIDRQSGPRLVARGRLHELGSKSHRVRVALRALTVRTFVTPAHHR